MTKELVLGLTHLVITNEGILIQMLTIKDFVPYSSISKIELVPANAFPGRFTVFTKTGKQHIIPFNIWGDSNKELEKVKIIIEDKIRRSALSEVGIPIKAPPISMTSTNVAQTNEKEGIKKKKGMDLTIKTMIVSIGIGLVIIFLGSLANRKDNIKNNSSPISATENGNVEPTYQEKEISQSKELSATPLPVPTPIIVESKTLIDDYVKLAVSETYSGKTIQTTAYISEIKSFLGDNYLRMDSKREGNSLVQINCYFEDKSVLTPLTKGQLVTVSGTLERMKIGTIFIKKCTLVR